VCQISGQIINPTQKSLKIGELTVYVSEDGTFTFEKAVERPLFIDVSYDDIEWTLFLEPDSRFSIQISDNNLDAIEYKGDLSSTNAYLLETNEITQKINRVLGQNWVQIHKQNQTDYISTIDSLKGLYLKHLTLDSERYKLFSGTFVNAWKAEINFAFNKFAIYYPKNHFNYTGEKVELNDEFIWYIKLPEIDTPDYSDLPNYNDYAKDWIDYRSEQLAEKDTLQMHYHFKKMDAVLKLIPDLFKNQYLRDYWYAEYLKEYIENNGLSNSQKYIENFHDSCKTEAFKNEIELYIETVMYAREDHEVQIYKTENAFNLEAHIFKPRNLLSTEKRPAIVIFHGGGWHSGNPSWAFSRAKYFSDLGMVAIAAQYRLTNEHDITAIESMADARDLIMWMRLNADSINILCDSIVGYGWSAGAHLITSAAIFCDSIPDSGINSIPNALVLVSPAVSLSKHSRSWEANVFGGKASVSSANPVEHVRKGLPTTLILEGRDDTVTPLDGVQAFCDKMQENGNYCELLIYDNVGHLFTPNTMSDKGMPKPDLKVQKRAFRDADEFLQKFGYIKELNIEMGFGLAMD